MSENVDEGFGGTLCSSSEHQFVEEYYGYKCNKCGLFYAYGTAPWDAEEHDSIDDEFDEEDDSDCCCDSRLYPDPDCWIHGL